MGNCHGPFMFIGEVLITKSLIHRKKHGELYYPYQVLRIYTKELLPLGHRSRFSLCYQPASGGDPARCACSSAPSGLELCELGWPIWWTTNNGRCYQTRLLGLKASFHLKDLLTDPSFELLWSRKAWYATLKLSQDAFEISWQAHADLSDLERKILARARSLPS